MPNLVRPNLYPLRTNPDCRRHICCSIRVCSTHSHHDSVHAGGEKRKEVSLTVIAMRMDSLQLSGRTSDPVWTRTTSVIFVLNVQTGPQELPSHRAAAAAAASSSHFSVQNVAFIRETRSAPRGISKTIRYLGYFCRLPFSRHSKWSQFGPVVWNPSPELRYFFRFATYHPALDWFFKGKFMHT